jgi:hypothetical protein
MQRGDKAGIFCSQIACCVSVFSPLLHVHIDRPTVRTGRSSEHSKPY